MVGDLGLEVQRGRRPRAVLAERFPQLLEWLGAPAGDSEGPGWENQGLMELLCRRAARLTLRQSRDFYLL